jgi:hypothetical protein
MTVWISCNYCMEVINIDEGILLWWSMSKPESHDYFYKQNAKNTRDDLIRITAGSERVWCFICIEPGHYQMEALMSWYNNARNHRHFFYAHIWLGPFRWRFSSSCRVYGQDQSKIKRWSITWQTPLFSILHEQTQQMAVLNRATSNSSLKK